MEVKVIADLQRLVWIENKPIVLFVENAEKEQIRCLIAPEIKALVADLETIVGASFTTQPFLTILHELRQLFYTERNQLVDQLEAQRRQLNKLLELTENDGLTLKTAQSYIRKHLDQYEWGQAFIDNFKRLQGIDDEMDHFTPSPEQFKSFVHYEFADRHGYLSYFRGGGGKH